MEQVTRRNFVKASLAGGLSLFTLANLSACSNSRGEQSSNAQSNATQNNGNNQSSQSQSELSQTEPKQGETMTSSNAKSLVVVFSHSGNTLKVAQYIKEKTGADFFRIEEQNPYSTDYNECVNFAKEEQNSNTLPVYVGDVQNFQDYDTVFIGYPIWWYDVPQIIKTFAGNHNWNQKTVIPFCTSGGSSISSGLDNLKNLCSGASFKDGITISGSSAGSSNGEVDTWLSNIGVV